MTPASEGMRANQNAPLYVQLPRDESKCSVFDKFKLSHVHTFSELQLHGKPVVHVN